MRVPFTKMEGCGNDYVFVDAIDGTFPLARGAELARAWSDRHFGIGGDGLIVLVRGRTSPIGMAMWNADGSVGAMCGNGLRCLAVFARERGHASSDAFVVDTAAGPREVAIERDACGAVAVVHADLGAVHVDREPVEVSAGGRRLRCHLGSAGNPHAVILLDVDPETFPVLEVGAALQVHERFPGGVNVEFVRVDADGALRQRTFERGSGETLACGTGAAAAALCALQNGLVRGPEVRVRLRGGELRVRRGERTLVLVGPARTVCRGEIDLLSQY